MRILISCSLLFALAGCADLRPAFMDRLAKKPEASETSTTGNEPMRPLPRPGEPGGPEVEVVEGDPFESSFTPEVTPTSTPAAEPSSDGRLGLTIASLGDPTQEGFWLKTPLVSAATSGRVYYDQTGRSVQVELIPSGGPAGGGSQISLAAMRLLEAPLTGLPELVVYSN